MLTRNEPSWLTTSARGRAVIEQWWRRGWGQGELDAADELHAPDVLMHSSFGELFGSEPVKVILGGLLNGASSLSYGYELIGSGHEFALVYWLKGLHSSTVYGVPASSKWIELRGSTSYRVEASQIREFWQTVTPSCSVGVKCLQGLAASSGAFPTTAWAVQWGLTAREASVAELVMMGSSDKDIAAELRLAPASVSKYVARVLAKAGVRARSQLSERAGIFALG